MPKLRPAKPDEVKRALEKLRHWLKSSKHGESRCKPRVQKNKEIASRLLVSLPGD